MQPVPAYPLDLSSLAIRFFGNVAIGKVEIYNEFSLQHELGIWLRSTLPFPYKVQFERNVRFFELACEDFLKKEIDIVVYDSQQQKKHAIELKYPRNGQYPEQMYSFCKDIRFLEQLCEAGFNSCEFIVAADDPLFYQGDATKTVYSFFRGGKPIKGVIEKPTGERSECITLSSEYYIHWNPVIDALRYAIVHVGK